MRHLGVVQKRGMMGNVVELQIFAREEGEYLWRTNKKLTPCDKTTADRLTRYPHGAMVMVELNDTNQVQRVDDAEEQILALLQGFGRQLEMFKNQAQEIETWRESLQYQAEALDSREQDWQNREHELLTELAQLRAGDDGADQGWQWAQLKAEQPLQTEYTNIQREPSKGSVDLSELQIEMSHLTEHLQAQSTQQQTFQRVLADLLHTIEYHLSELFPQLEALGEHLNLCEQEQQELTVRASALPEPPLTPDQRIILTEWLHQIEHQQQQLALLIERCGGQITTPTATATPEELEQLRRRLSEQQRDYLQRANQVLQQDEEARLQQEQLEQLQQRLQELRNENADPEEIADVEDELDFIRQACIDLRESVARQKVRLANDEAHLNEERDLLTKLVAQQEGTPAPVTNPHQALLPDLKEALAGLNQLHQHLGEQLKAGPEAYQNWQQEQASLTQEQLTLAVRRASLEVQLRSLEERHQILASQQVMLSHLHLWEGPDTADSVRLLDQLNAQLAVLAGTP
ncbi:hypothetical protein [Candidatus Cyanaurora vandensis]|uniref:hypothetical protein n=1 Tax=Candidatus Cyanaurora vandensis TaxID=2714958 RepID=UPI00257FFDF2|nr:hypothetical protein [Candidatus Cyanaurora vandensis]